VADDVRGLRILAFCDYFSAQSSGGSERVAREVYSRLGAAGAEISVLSATNAPPAPSTSFRVTTVPCYELSGAVGGQLTVSPRLWREAFHQCRAFRPHVVHTNSLHFHGSLVAATLARRERVPLVTTAHVGGLDELRGPIRQLSSAYEQVFGRYVLRHSHSVIAVSQAVAAHLRRLHVAGARVRVIPNGVDHAQFQPIAGDADPRPIALFVGRLISNKGPDLLLRAVAQSRTTRPFRVVYLGDGPLRGAVEAQAAELGLAETVEFRGHVEDVSPWLAASRIVIRPSFTEGMPLTVLEAMASGRCVVVSDLPGNRELVQNGRTGLVFRVGDAADLARCLDRLLDEPALTDRLGRAAAAASQQYSWDRTASGYAAVLHEAVGQSATIAS